MTQIIKQLQVLWLRNWRIAESRLLFFALLISVTAVSSVTFFADRTNQAMQSQASQIMGGDLVVQSSRPLSESYRQQAEILGIKTAEIISFPSMVLVNEKSQLVQVKAASTNYPLFGEIQIKDSLSSQGHTQPFSELATNQAWAEPHLLVALGIQPNTEIQLGQSQVQIAGIISKSPDQGSSVFEFMPQVLIPLKDLLKTGLLTPASRAKFSLLFAGELKQIEKLRSWLKPRLLKTEKINSLKDGIPSVQQALQRGQKFLSMASLLSVILAGVAIALTSYSLSQRETNTVAVLKTMGASRRQIIRRYSSQLFLLATVAAILGIITGFFIQLVLSYVLRDMIGQTLPSPSFKPVVSGLMTAWVMVLGFSLPQLVRLVNISPVRIFQKQDSTLSKQILFPIIALVLGVAVLIGLQVHEFVLSLGILVGLAIIMACFWLFSVLSLKILTLLNSNNSSCFHLSLPKANFRIALLMMVFGIGFFSLLLLTALKTDLLNRWQASLPDHAPNYFLINIQPDEVEPLNQYLRQSIKGSLPNSLSSSSMTLTTTSTTTSTTATTSTTPFTLYPMIRGRLTEINSKKVSIEDFKRRRARGLLSREANISTAIKLPDGNTIVSGQWFNPTDSEGLSIEEGIAEVLNLKLGDDLTFDIAGQKFKQAITSIRTVRWDSMQPNFFIMAAPTALQNHPRTFMTSIYVSEQDKQFVPGLIKQYPSVSAIDISTLLSKIKELINKAAFAVQAIFVFALLSGIVVLFAALQSQKAERRKEIAILKSMGARHSYLRKNIITEFVLIGSIAGFIAAIFAMFISNLLAYQLFDLTPAINYYLLLVGVVSGGLFVGVGGYMNLKPLLDVSTIGLFQE